MELIEFAGRKRPIVLNNAAYLLFADVMQIPVQSLQLKTNFTPYEAYALIFAAFKQGHIDMGVDWEFRKLSDFIDAANLDEDGFIRASEYWQGEIRKHAKALIEAGEIVEEDRDDVQKLIDGDPSDAEAEPVEAVEEKK